MKKNYLPSSTVSLASALFGPPYDLGFFMIFSQKKAREIIKKLLSKGRKITEAYAGLDGDWNENNCLIYDGKKFHKYDAYEGSCWATPILIINFDDGPSEAYEVWAKKAQ